MSTPVRIGGFLAGLAVVFFATLGIGSAVGDRVGPAEPAEHEMPAGEHGPDGDAHESDAPTTPPGLQMAQSGYGLSPVAAPSRLGVAGRLSFKIISPDGQPLTAFDDLHEKKLHLIVVRQDTDRYRHVHPTLAADGTWSIPWRWAAAGSYKIFTDFQPTALGENITLARFVDVAGPYRPTMSRPESRTVTVDDFTVTLSGDLQAGEAMPITATVKRAGQPVKTLQPYLGAYGHLVALRSGDLAYLHVHPGGEPGDGQTQPGPNVKFFAEAPTAGTYRLFFDFQVDGTVHTAEFTIPTQP